MPSPARPRRRRRPGRGGRPAGQQQHPAGQGWNDDEPPQRGGGERGFLYLATVLDLHSRRLAGWSIAEHMRTDLVIDALRAAQRTRGSLHGAIMHTDHGAQYTSRAFAAECQAAGVRQSMSAVGSSADNAAAESFNATFKRETLQGRRAFTDEREAKSGLLSSIRTLSRSAAFSARGCGLGSRTGRGNGADWRWRR